MAMGRHRLRHDYARASRIATMIFNMARDPRSTRPLEADDLNPYAPPATSKNSLRVAEAADFERLRKRFNHG